ncbi:hypothetical protein [Dactylosporangium sp. CA-233914]|uniref:hypothetical protein n=1 Tax=Dactylosporangium sp. CA-233914 TaxID=3239934 RepID=UPI003D8FFEC2
MARILVTGSTDGIGLETARYFKRRQDLKPNPSARDVRYQDGLLRAGAALSGVTL